MFKTDTHTLLSRPAVYTDYYELTMAQGYFLGGRAEEQACFDYFFRALPFDGGYVVHAGISDFLEILSDFKFHEDELDYLSDQGFHPDFIQYLRDDFRLSVNIQAAREGEVVFPLEPVIRVEGSIIQAQILETLLLNVINFESLIATKAARMKYAAKGRNVLDFGLRRAQGFGGIQASKAAIIGGVDATSNVYSSFVHGIPASGTMAHSWIQSFDDELTSFRTFAEYFPHNCVLLVDTYSTLSSGVPNAITVAKEMEERGHRLKGIRLDSGDLAYFARKTRKQLDEAGLDYVQIVASNQLDEYLIKSLLTQDAPIDAFGVGTRLVTGHESPALDGVYKLSSVHGTPRLKVSENVEKITLPGIKEITRFTDSSGMFYGDGISLKEEKAFDSIFHPYYPAKHTNITTFDSEPLLRPVMRDGELITELPSACESADYAGQRLQKLNPEHKRFENPHIYIVGISEQLMNLRDELVNEHKSK